MTKINAFREIERKLADSLAQLEATRLSQARSHTAVGGHGETGLSGELHECLDDLPDYLPDALP